MCCIGKYEFLPVVEYVGKAQNRIITKGFFNISIKNVGDATAKILGGNKILEAGEEYCIGITGVECGEDVLVSWPDNPDATGCRLEVLKYTIQEKCSE